LIDAFEPNRQRQIAVLVVTADPTGSSIASTEDWIMLMKFFKDETGLELSEYAVAAALVAVATVAAFELLGTSIAARIERLAGFIQ
jgi:pilus assembly protein Flp/PilA